MSGDAARGPADVVRRRPAAHRHVHAVRVQDAQPPGELQRSQVHRLHHVHHLRHLDRLRRPTPQHRENGSQCQLANVDVLWCRQAASRAQHKIRGLLLPL